MSEAAGRVLLLEGVHNFRDFGGYGVTGGGRLRRGVLWRSGQHHGASDADLARIGELGLVAVFDLRVEDERQRHPCRRPPGFEGRVFTLADQAAVEEARAAPHIAALDTGAVLPSPEPDSQRGARQSRPRTPQAMRESMRRHYAEMPFRPAMAAMFRRYLAEIGREVGAGAEPSLIHCMAGKDRTGVAVALTQRALGVHADDVMADYLLTNTAGDQAARLAAGARTIRDRLGLEVAEDVLRVVMAVEPEYLDIAFAAIRERLGSEDAYFNQILGLAPSGRDRLREVLVEDL